ncbi:MAG: hypothetical protein KJ954_14340 [Alphaproteobacteria bacterium]|nr:hypothetical protein [Alphaproteobacteria bacterium]
MAEAYTITLTIKVTKAGQADAIVTEENIFSDKSFGSMTILAAEYYDLITKLRGKK